MERRTYSYYAGRRVTNMGFTNAVDFNGKCITFCTKDGRIEPVMMGVSEFGVPGVKEFKRGENHMKSHRVAAHFVLWLPNADGINKGVTIDGEMYKETQCNPEQYPDRLEILKEYGIPLTINCD